MLLVSRTDDIALSNKRARSCVWRHPFFDLSRTYREPDGYIGGYTDGYAVTVVVTAVTICI